MVRAIVAHAARQGGAVSRAQVLRLGAEASQIARWKACGWLISEHRGVLRLGALTNDGVLFAAVLAVGDGSAVSHLWAAHTLGMLRGPPPAAIHVTAPDRRRPRRGIVPHRARLQPADLTTRRGIPVTSVSRTLLDVAASEPEPLLQATVDEARVRGVLRPRAIEATIARAPGHHGIGALRRAVALHDPGRGIPWSAFERRALAFLRDRDFPSYVRNHPIDIDGEQFVPDIVWPAQRVWLELDSRAFHDNDPGFARDRRRSRRLGAHGWPGVRATWQDFEARPDELAADLWAHLARGS